MLNYSGDPKLYLDKEGSYLNFSDGQPDMDQGIENMIFIALFTRPAWPGNVLFDDPSEQIGSDFEEAVKQPITVTSLNDIRDAAEKALSNNFFGDVIVTVTNPVSTQLKINIELPGQKLQVLIKTTNNGINWETQVNKEIRQ